jgi:hypothetical protein
MERLEVDILTGGYPLLCLVRHNKG